MPIRTDPDDRARSAREAVSERRARSLEEPLDVRLRSRSPFVVLEVRNPIHRTGYLVLLPEFPSRSSALCTCTDFARRGLGTCKHLEAGFRWIGEHPEAVPLRPDPGPDRGAPGRWRRIDAGLAAAVRGGSVDAGRWRRAGRLLIEGSP